MWTPSKTNEYDRRSRKWSKEKKYRREYLAVHDNLDTYINALNSGRPIQHAKFGFIHPEPMGVLAIDQKGAGPATTQLRLYVYPEEETEILHTITLGGKDTQHDDIQLCKQFVKELTAGKSQASAPHRAPQQISKK